MPRLWNETIETHRRDVRHAILSTTAALVADRGLLNVTMSQIAEQAGIGRATLYKYFPDVESILLAWHAEQIAHHLAHLADVRDRAGGPLERLKAVLDAFAAVSRGSRGHFDTGLVAALHRGEHVAQARNQVRDLIRDLLVDAAAAGEVRGDVAPEELAAFCVHALAAAASLPSGAAVRRLVEVVLAGLRPGGR
ncbi:TetR/AcrR family transcriptional regulator [Lentzea sp. CC55]|uniref:TetR/AcrR family transcriptional regulator n=1 Tax=Lentzea sp. CC55 TaxID=2884909 RepID=UPI0027DF6BCB|nr:TetR/AcrR family transcriptional regulator [Lentzea sp. CC55]MCG8925498.1 TetR/AcrR family transcriptional regulator [Lentzea sp. CC55]